MSAAGAVLLACICLGAGLGAVLRAEVLARVAERGARGGTAWVNVPASAVAGLAVGLGSASRAVTAVEPGAPGAAVVALAAVLGVCGGLSTYSSLALELARALLAGDRRELLLHAAGVLLGLLGAVGGVGAAVLLTTFAR